MGRNATQACRPTREARPLRGAAGTDGGDGCEVFGLGACTGPQIVTVFTDKQTDKKNTTFQIHHIALSANALFRLTLPRTVYTDIIFDCDDYRGLVQSQLQST